MINFYSLSEHVSNFLSKMYLQCSEDYENCKYYSYNGLKGYKFTVLTSLEEGIESKVEAI